MTAPLMPSIVAFPIKNESVGSKELCVVNLFWEGTYAACVTSNGVVSAGGVQVRPSDLSMAYIDAISAQPIGGPTVIATVYAGKLANGSPVFMLIDTTTGNEVANGSVEAIVQVQAFGN